MNFFRRLASFDDDMDFRKAFRIGMIASGVLVLLSIACLGVRQLNLGIDFRGGTVWEITDTQLSTDDAEASIEDLVGDSLVIQTVGRDSLRIETGPRTQAERTVITDALTEVSGKTAADISVSTVGPSWGSEVSSKALRALVFFFIAVAAYISIRLEWRMAVAAIVAVAHDIVISVGVYSLLGLEVTPATVIAFLTILGFSLYDTIVVFDKVETNVDHLGASGKHTFTDLANLSLNQTMMRSINTTVAACLPVLSILIIGAGVMGAVTLEEFGYALIVGMFVGAYSSIFVAAPVLIFLKEREPRYVAIRKRLEERAGRPAGGTKAAAPATAAVAAGATEDVGGGVATATKPAAPKPSGKSTPGLYSSNHPPRPRKQGKKR